MVTAARRGSIILSPRQNGAPRAANRLCSPREIHLSPPKRAGWPVPVLFEGRQEVLHCPNLKLANAHRESDLAPIGVDRGGTPRRPFSPILSRSATFHRDSPSLAC